jgi:drug/metabolite transporter (DMT)-like permease
MKTIQLILICVLLNTSGELLMKHGMTVLGELHLSWEALPTTISRVISSPFNFAGLALYGVSAFLWFVILSREELSYALPLVSLTYVTVGILSWLFFKEALSLTRLFGIALICCGVFFVSRS